MKKKDVLECASLRNREKKQLQDGETINSNKLRQTVKKPQARDGMLFLVFVFFCNGNNMRHS